MPGAQRCVGSGNSPVVLERVEIAAKKVPLAPKVMQGGGGGVPEASFIPAMWVLGPLLLGLAWCPRAVQILTCPSGLPCLG